MNNLDKIAQIDGRNETAKDKLDRITNPRSKNFISQVDTGAGIKLTNAVTMSVNSEGYCVLNCDSTIAGDDDFVGIYSNASLPQSDNLGGGGGWQWVIHSDDFPFTTSVQAQEGLVAIYWSKDYRTSDYVRVCYTGGLTSSSPGTSVSGSSQ